MAVHRRMGQVKPPPFKRKSITIGEKKRSWRKVNATEVAIGDTVAEFGLVSDIDFVMHGRVLTLVNMEGTEKRFQLDEVLLVFK